MIKNEALIKDVNNILDYEKRIELEKEEELEI